MSDKPVPKPRVDEQGVPWCNGTCCWYQTQPLVRPECCAPCHVGTPCLPAVRAMARDLAEARAERDTAMLKQRHTIVNECQEKLSSLTASVRARCERLEQELSEARAEAMTARGRLEVVGLGVYPYRDGPMRGSSNPKPWEVRMDRPIWGRPEIDDEDLKAVLRKLNLFPTHLAALDAARAALVKAGIIKEEGR